MTARGDRAVAALAELASVAAELQRHLFERDRVRRRRAWGMADVDLRLLDARTAAAVAELELAAARAVRALATLPPARAT